ncbi:MAG TPA: Sir2 family NAD-dependent protein deacetylase [Actinomycetota bacterium]|jgi:NAD-dependent deacetylase
MDARTGFEEQLHGVAAWIREARTVVALTGAGVSTDSGIPDFRGPNGVWTKDPKAERMSTLQNYLADPELRVKAWQMRLEHPGWTAKPSPAHRALAELERRDRLQTLITQNIDGLHQAAGTSPARLVEIHGTMREVVCMSCGDRAPMQKALDRVRAGEADPDCRTCGGILKSATISFGQSLVREDLERAYAAAGSCDVFLAIGSSLTVFPVANLPQIALGNGAKLVVLNGEPTPYDALADAVVTAPLAETLPTLLDLI